MKIKKFLPVLVVVFIFTLVIGFTLAGAAEAGGQSSEKTITAGKTYDVSLGHCGMYFTALQDGTLKLGREDRSRLPLKFMKDACTVEFEDSNETIVTKAKGILISYFVLDKVQYDKWNAGELAFYVKDGSWKPCAATWVPGGAYGRLSCWTGGYFSFGIVDLAEKEEDDDDKKHTKAPSGELVSAGQVVDKYEGNCGVYVAGMPTLGYVDVEHVERSDFNLKFMKDPCDFTFEDADENGLSTKGSLVIGYVNLNPAQLEVWEAGDLGFFANYGSGWDEINPMLVSENGKPRLCATMSGPGMFGVVDMTPKPVEDDIE